MSLLDANAVRSHPTFDGVELDETIRPQDDFYGYVNERWSQQFELTDHRSDVTMLSQLSEKVHSDVTRLIEAAAAGPRGEQDISAGQIADLYTSFMDEDRIENLDPSAAWPDLAAIRSAASRDELARVIGRLQAHGVGGIVELSVTTDTARAEHYVLILSQSGISLPRPSMYTAPEHQELRNQYASHIATMLAHAEVPDAAESAARAVQLEADLAALHIARDARGRDASKPISSPIAELAQRDGEFPWHQWFAGLGAVPSEATVCVRQSGFLAALDTWWQSHDLEELRLWLTWRYVHEMAPFGSRQVFADNFAFYGRALNGFTQPRTRPLRATSIVETFLGEAVGQRYVAEHLDPETVTAARGLVEQLVASYRSRLERADWMQDSTRGAALHKLDCMTFEIGAPSRVDSRDGLQMDPRDLVGNVLRGRQWEVARELDRLSAAVDREDWKVHPQQVTAYYRHGLNHVVIPAAILQPPVFDRAGDSARNFAVLGSIICHEMTHAFDSRGARFDERGRVRNWWAPEDTDEYNRRAALLVAHYDRCRIRGLEDLRISGARTLGENIADIVGVTVAQTAFADHLRTRGSHPPDDQTQAEQARRFFIHWATMWRAKSAHARRVERLATDRHAPPEVRCNGALGHVEAFYTAFDIGPDDALYVAPEARFSLV